MDHFHCVVARTVREIMDAQRVRWQVYGEEEELLPAAIATGGRETDARDYSEGTTHFLVYAGQEPVGTVRLLQGSAADRQSTRSGHRRLGLDLEAKFDLGALATPGVVPAEVTRFCVLRRYRCTGVTSALFAGLHATSLQRRITHWVAGANMGTDCPEDAAIAYRVACQKRLMSERFRADPLAPAPARTRRRWSCYNDDQRRRAQSGELAGLNLPRTLALFAGRMSARFIGSPAYDDYFNVFALPLVAALADLPAADSKRQAEQASARPVLRRDREGALDVQLDLAVSASAGHALRDEALGAA